MSIIVLVSTILCIPSYAEHRIVSVVLNETSQLITAYRFEETSFSKSLLLRQKVFVLHSVMFKLIPCVFLLLFSFLLIQQLRQALEKSEILYRNSSTTITSTNAPMSNGRLRGRRREKENRRTTLMLVIVCVLFLITELPQGAILLLTFLSKTNSQYYFQIYQHLGNPSNSSHSHPHDVSSLLGDTFDILALINNSVNFILYCLMSRAFRDTFKQTFCLCIKVDHQQTVNSNAHNKQRKRHLNQSIACETTVRYKCSEGEQTSLVPSRKSSSDHQTPMEKKEINKALQLFNRSS